MIEATTALPTGLRPVRLLDADPEFARAVPAADRALADRALTVRLLTVEPGDHVRCDGDGAVACVVLDGAAWREVIVGEVRAPQLLGPGSVVLPDAPPSDLLGLRCEIVAMTSVDVAVLDRRFLMASTRWPQLTTILHARVTQQERDLGALTAIGHLARVDDRLLALLWHLAERWGTVRSEGVHLPLQLTHSALGRFVAARRPTVSLALAELRESGRVVRESDGSWLLRGDPPAIVNGSRAGHLPPPELFPRARAARGSAR